jgi:hypothetical protein
MPAPKTDCVDYIDYHSVLPTKAQLLLNGAWYRAREFGDWGFAEGITHALRLMLPYDPSIDDRLGELSDACLDLSRMSR